MHTPEAFPFELTPYARYLKAALLEDVDFALEGCPFAHVDLQVEILEGVLDFGVVEGRKIAKLKSH